MTDATQAVLTVGMPTLAVLVGILVNNSRLSDLKSYIDMRFVAVDHRFDALDRRIDEVKETLRAELMRVEQVMDARLRHLEENL
jgi:hypothetical protein